jgi:hypothetical protein
MATADDPTATAFFVLTAWCTATRRWLDLPGRFDSVQDAQRLAIERGIYRVVYVRDERRLGMEPFAIVGDD